jgi:CDP-diacylglycerol---serine O-phosphatidyltransferase
MNTPLDHAAEVTTKTVVAARNHLAILPHLVTLAALASGMAAIIFAIDGSISRAIGCVVLAAALDACDGRLARLTGTSSPFGAELDSLSDVICFGAAPAIILGQWGMASFGPTGWLVCLLVTFAAALRLARFNIAVNDPNKPVWSSAFFQGVPAPAGGFLVLLPVYAHFSELLSAQSAQQLAFIWCPAVAAFMVSRIPTFSGKLVSRMMFRVWCLVVVVALLLLALTYLGGIWLGLVFAAAGYLCLMPFSIWRRSILASRN